MCRECGRIPCRPQCPNAEPEIAYRCEYCDEPVYVGDECYEFDDAWICIDCLSEYLDDYARNHKKIAEALNDT